MDQAVKAFITKYLDAYNRKDAAGVAALYAEDGLLVPPGPITTGKQNIEKAWRAVFDAGRTGLRYDIHQVQAEGNIVWSVGQFTVMAPDESGVLQERQGNFANVYQWEGDVLKFRVHAFSFLPLDPNDGDLHGCGREYEAVTARSAKITRYRGAPHVRGGLICVSNRYTFRIHAGPSKPAWS